MAVQKVSKEIHFKESLVCQWRTLHCRNKNQNIEFCSWIKAKTVLHTSLTAAGKEDFSPSSAFLGLTAEETQRTLPSNRRRGLDGAETSQTKTNCQLQLLKLSLSSSHSAALHLLPLHFLSHRNRFLIQRSICLLSCSAPRSRPWRCCQGPRSTRTEGRLRQFAYCSEQSATDLKPSMTSGVCSGQREAPQWPLSGE